MIQCFEETEGQSTTISFSLPRPRVIVSLSRPKRYGWEFFPGMVMLTLGMIENDYITISPQGDRVGDEKTRIS